MISALIDGITEGIEMPLRNRLARLHDACDLPLPAVSASSDCGVPSPVALAPHFMRRAAWTAVGTILGIVSHFIAGRASVYSRGNIIMDVLWSRRFWSLQSNNTALNGETAKTGLTYCKPLCTAAFSTSEGEKEWSLGTRPEIRLMSANGGCMFTRHRNQLRTPVAWRKQYAAI